MKNVKKNPFLKRYPHIPRVWRIIPLTVVERINTIFGEETIVHTKTCTCCKKNQPIDNYYAKTSYKRKGKTEYELTSKDMESICISCWELKDARRKDKLENLDIIEFF